MSTGRLYVVIGFVLLFPAHLSAQWLGSVSLESGYDDNAFSNASATPSALGSVSLQLGYFSPDDIWAANYSGGLYNYIAFPDRQFSSHTAGFSFRLPYGEAETNQFSALISGTTRLDRETFKPYDYSQVMGRIEINHTISALVRSKAGYYARYRSYPNFNALSYLEHSAWLSESSFLPTRTSISAQVEFGHKNYLSKSISGIQPEPLGTGTIAEGMIVDGGGGGNGSGRSGGNGDQGGGNGLRPGLSEAGLSSGADPNTMYLLFEEPSTSQIRAWVNVGQSLADGTGLSVRYLQRWNLTDRGRAFVGGAVDFIGEEELFDDPYSYESQELLLRLTQLLPWSAEVQIAGFYYRKNYGYPGTLDYDTGADDPRTDDRYGGWLSISKALPGNLLMFSGLRLNLQYTYTRNMSNTMYYDYRSNYVGLGISTDF